MPAKKGKKSKSGEKRSVPRIATSNLLGYVCLDEEGEEVSEGYAWTLDLSVKGLRMEAFRYIETKRVLLLAIDLDEQLVEIQGKVIYHKENEKRKHIYGIKFFGSEQEQQNKIAKFVKSYYHRDKKLVEKMNKEA
ncbi:MAG: PilZ domain-containing protein [Desulfobacteraceae bacterium]|jgi:c-di-GMP-binding flagellar brake protein YcgR